MLAAMHLTPIGDLADLDRPSRVGIGDLAAGSAGDQVRGV